MSLRDDISKRNNIKIIGGGSDVLMFAHGFGCDQRIWEGTLAALQNKYSIVLFDYVGAGKSSKECFSEARYQSIQGYVQDVIDIIEAFDFDNVTFIGHSISGAVGYLVALALPTRIKKIIAISPSACYLNYPAADYYGGFEESDIHELFAMMEHNFYEWAGFLAPRAMNQDAKPELADDLAASFRASDPVILQSFARATFLCDVREILPQVSVHVVILFGTADMVVPKSAIDYQVEHLPQCEAIELDVKGHYPHVSEPEKVAAGIEKYLI